MRSPASPDDIVAIWDYFLDKVPFWLWDDHTVRNSGGSLIQNVIGERFIYGGYFMAFFRHSSLGLTLC